MWQRNNGTFLVIIGFFRGCVIWLQVSLKSFGDQREFHVYHFFQQDIFPVSLLELFVRFNSQPSRNKRTLQSFLSEGFLHDTFPVCSAVIAAYICSKIKPFQKALLFITNVDRIGLQSENSITDTAHRTSRCTICILHMVQNAYLHIFSFLFTIATSK